MPGTRSRPGSGAITIVARFAATRSIMSYAKSVLQPGERMIVSERLHWIIYGWAILYLVAGVVLVGVESWYMPSSAVIASTAAIFGALFVVTFAYAWFIRWITEFSVTDRRVISARGFIWRQTEEMNMDKVETVDIEQSILGRILGYGTIRITGTGGSNDIAVHRIAMPFSLRNAIIAK
jgi:uncharacterized membrane protein YdbT with pleckstrin-like domain